MTDIVLMMLIGVIVLVLAMIGMGILSIFFGVTQIFSFMTSISEWLADSDNIDVGALQNIPILMATILIPLGIVILEYFYEEVTVGDKDQGEKIVRKISVIGSQIVKEILPLKNILNELLLGVTSIFL